MMEEILSKPEALKLIRSKKQKFKVKATNDIIKSPELRHTLQRMQTKVQPGDESVDKSISDLNDSHETGRPDIESVSLPRRSETLRQKNLDSIREKFKESMVGLSALNLGMNYEVTKKKHLSQ